MTTERIQFIVTMEGTDPPPGWAGDMLRILRKELRLSMGKATTVESVPPGSSLSRTIEAEEDHGSLNGKWDVAGARLKQAGRMVIDPPTERFG